MKHLRTLDSTTLHITPIIMGCWQAGKKYWQNISDTESEQAIQAAFDAGITTFDTASEYGDGHSERLIGKTLKPIRQQVVIATKVFANMLRYQQVLDSCEASLRNLQTDYIDLYQIHWPSGSFGTPVVPISETMRALNELQKQGKIRAIGVSNFSVDQIKEAQQYGHIVSVQPPYSLFWRQAGDALTPYCVEHNITILAYSPLAQGLLTGRFTEQHHFPSAELRSQHKLCAPEHYQRVQNALAQLKPIAECNQISLAQLALAWLITQPHTCAIAGARKADQVRDNARAMDVVLSSADLQKIDAIGRTVTQHLNDNPVMWNNIE